MVLICLRVTANTNILFTMAKKEYYVCAIDKNCPLYYILNCTLLVTSYVSDMNIQVIGFGEILHIIYIVSGRCET
jgi:hypothetical protein